MNIWKPRDPLVPREGNIKMQNIQIPETSHMSRNKEVDTSQFHYESKKVETFPVILPKIS